MDCSFAACRGIPGLAKLEPPGDGTLPGDGVLSVAVVGLLFITSFSVSEY